MVSYNYIVLLGKFFCKLTISNFLYIVILIILAVVAINYAFGDNGIVKYADEAKFKAEKASAREEIELVLLEAGVEKTFNSEYDENGFLNRFVEARLEGIELSQDEVTYKGFIFALDRSVPRLGDYTGQAIGPRIKEIKVTETTTNSISIEVDARNAEGGKYSYLYKKLDEEEWIEAEKDVETNTYTFEGLEENIIYNIKVRIETKEGSIEKTINEMTGERPQGTIQFTPPEWVGDGTAKVTINTEVEEKYELQYIIIKKGEDTEGIEDREWKKITSGSEITGLYHGDTVYGRLYDGVNQSDYANVSVEDKTAPNIPTIILSGTEGNNGWYKSDVSVTITAGNDAQSGTNKIKYSVNGSQTIAETTTEEGITTTSITITVDGTSEITAYTVDKAGNVSTLATQTVMKDTTVPTATINVGTPTHDSIPITVTASDGQSGLATSGTYKYYLNEEEVTTIKENTYTYEGLSDGTTYTLKVEVYDKAGNVCEKTERASTEISALGGTALEIAAHPEIYYGLEVMGYDCENQGIEKWRIFYADDTNIYLIADTSLLVTDCPKTSTEGTGVSTSVNGKNKVYFQYIYDDYSGAEWIKENSKASYWMKDYLNLFPDSDRAANGAVAYIMDTEAWSVFQGPSAEWAIGSPTVELYCASYKQIYPDLYPEYRPITPGYYQFKWSDDDVWYSLWDDPNIKSGPNGIYMGNGGSNMGMWLAGAGTNDETNMVTIDSSHRVEEWYVTHYNTSAGLRPIICLKSDVEIEKVYDDLYRISNY